MVKLDKDRHYLVYLSIRHSVNEAPIKELISVVVSEGPFALCLSLVPVISLLLLVFSFLLPYGPKISIL